VLRRFQLRLDDSAKRVGANSCINGKIIAVPVEQLRATVERIVASQKGANIQRVLTRQVKLETEKAENTFREWRVGASSGCDIRGAELCSLARQQHEVI